jgi:hypothetical protein
MTFQLSTNEHFGILLYVETGLELLDLFAIVIAAILVFIKWFGSMGTV